MKKMIVQMIILLMPFAALAESPLQSVLEQYVVEKNEKGEEVFRPAKEEEPGTTIEYRLILTYIAECEQEDIKDCALEGLMPTMPVPVGTEYVADSARAVEFGGLQVSIDNGVTWGAEPLKRLVIDERGNEKEVVIPASEYTSLRWVVSEPVLPNQVRNYSYRVVME